MGQVSGKVIGAQLLSRVAAVFQKIFYPFFVHRKVLQKLFLLLLWIQLHQLGFQNQQIAALLHRHLVSEIIHLRAGGHLPEHGIDVACFLAVP